MIELCLDIETSGLNFKLDSITSISFTSAKSTKSFLVNHSEATMTEREALDKIQCYINKSDLLIGHNIKFDLLFLKEAGIDYSNKEIFDTAIAKYILTYQREKMPSLDKCLQDDLGMAKVEGMNFKEVPAPDVLGEELLYYNEGDTKGTYELYKLYSKKLKDKGMDIIHRLSSNYSKVLVDMEYNGCCIDTDSLDSMTKDTKAELNVLNSKLISMLEYPININSTQQLSCALYGGKFTQTIRKEVRQKFKTWPFWRWKTRNIEEEIELKGIGFSTKGLELNKQGYYPCDENTLVRAKCRTKKAREYKELYKKYRKLNTLYEKYLTKYVEHLHNGFVNTVFQQTSTITGRLSSTKPNIQQLPRPDKEMPNVKSLFISRFKDGRILDIDFSQIEWRISAVLCGDPTMLQEIKDGVDAHISNASLAFSIPIEEVTKEQRQIAKMVSFGILYGQTAWGMAYNRDDIPVHNEEEAQKIIDTVLNKYPKLKRMHNLDIAKAKSKGILSTPSGRAYDFRGSFYRETNIKNNKVQGLATADIVPMAIYEVWKQIKDIKECKIINSVHDCLVLDCKDNNIALDIKNKVMDIFNNVPTLAKSYFNLDITVPIASEAEMGNNWGDMKEIS